MKIFDLPKDAVDFAALGDWNSEVRYRGSPLKISIEPPVGLSDDAELVFFRTRLLKIQESFPAFIESAFRAFYIQYVDTWCSGEPMSPEEFRSTLRPSEIFIGSKESIVELDDAAALFGDHAIVARFDEAGTLVGVCLEG